MIYTAELRAALTDAVWDEFDPTGTGALGPRAWDIITAVELVPLGTDLLDLSDADTAILDNLDGDADLVRLSHVGLVRFNVSYFLGI